MPTLWRRRARPGSNQPVHHPGGAGCAAPPLRVVGLIKHVASNDNNIQVTLRSDRVPIRESSTSSPAYAGGDRCRALPAQEMQRRRFVIAAPCGKDMLPFPEVVTTILSRQLSLTDALRSRGRRRQEIIDRYLVRDRTVPRER